MNSLVRDIYIRFLSREYHSWTGGRNEFLGKISYNTLLANCKYERDRKRSIHNNVNQKLEG